jgi:Transcriptional activator of glycolytic enzymes
MRTQFDALKAEFHQLKRVVARFANRPAQTVGGFFEPRRHAAPATAETEDDSNSIAFVGNNGGGEIPYAATLSTFPKDLWVLWEEYTTGLQGRKAARCFTSRERGRVRYKYHHRKVVWDKIAEMVRQGLSYHVAIDEIYRVYGQRNKVTEIINKMRSDRIRGGNPELGGRVR